MTISTIITVYNLEKYIEETLLSVFNQTKRPDEIIVVDDCSTDNSASIINKYASQLTYIKMPKNSGVMLAFIRGIEEAKGDILSFLDGDDIWHENKLAEIEKAFLDDDNRVLVTHNYECIDGNSKARNYSDDKTYSNTSKLFKKSEGNLDVLSNLFRNAILCQKGVWLGSAFCINHKYLNIAAFKKIVLSFPNIELPHQDQPFAIFLLLENLDKRIFYIDKVLFKYRIFGDNSSGKSNDVASALKTALRTYHTNIITQSLVSKFPNLIEENKRQKDLVTSRKYMYELYNKEYFKAVKKFFYLSFNHWSFFFIKKELKRIVAVIILGPKLFLKIK